MCGRYLLGSVPDAVTEHFNVFEPPDFELVPRFNIAPGQLVPVVHMDHDVRVLRSARWGLVPSFERAARNGVKRIHARAESVHETRAFREAFTQRRCLLPAAGFYEWSGGTKDRTPHVIRLRERGLFAMAGVWEGWTDVATGASIETVAVLTVAANATVAPLHDRMPVIFTGARAFDRWLDPHAPEDALRAMLRPYPIPERFECYAVSPRVNGTRDDDPSLLEPAAQGALFG